MPAKTQSIFSNFTNKYQLSKTLRFELKPTEETKKLLALHRILEKDYTINESYHQAKYYFDEMHREFLKFALDPKKARNLPFEKLHQSYNSYLRLEKEKQRSNQNFRKTKDEFRKEVKLHLDKEADEWIKQFATTEKQEDKDDVVPLSQSQKLFDNLICGKHLEITKGADHDIAGDDLDQANAQIANFFKEKLL